MGKLSHLKPDDVFSYFEELCSIPHGSGNMEKISSYCLDFAKKHNLWAHRDEANNVIIKKDASRGYENTKPIILQGHLDMVCQKNPDISIQFETDGLDIFEDGKYIKAKGTTLGADNGIAVAMIMAILADKTLSHPPIEAVFTTDEEIGMIGASALDMSLLQGKRMINIDSEDPSVVTVSCAGGSEFGIRFPIKREKRQGKIVELTIGGLRGGHSGVEINSGRLNANVLMGRLLHHLRSECYFDIISIDGGDKGNAIPISCVARLCMDDTEKFALQCNEYAKTIREEIKGSEPDFYLETKVCDISATNVLQPILSEQLLHTLILAPNGVVQMSAEIDNLVETSLNMGIVSTKQDEIYLLFALRSNKITALSYLEERLMTFFAKMDCETETGGYYPPWEYKKDSSLRDIYTEKYKQKKGVQPRVEAIHAGLECGVFAKNISGFDCISIGPEMFNIHTTHERLSIDSTKEIYEIICLVLEDLK